MILISSSLARVSPGMCSAMTKPSIPTLRPSQSSRPTGALFHLRQIVAVRRRAHTKLESTVRYLAGIEIDDALSISEQVEL